jgi:hypothetical protein
MNKLEKEISDIFLENRERLANILANEIIDELFDYVKEEIYEEINIEFKEIEAKLNKVKTKLIGQLINKEN